MGGRAAGRAGLQSAKAAALGRAAPATDRPPFAAPCPACSLDWLRLEAPGALGLCIDDLWAQVAALEVRAAELLLGVAVTGMAGCIRAQAQARGMGAQ